MWLVVETADKLFSKSTVASHCRHLPYIPEMNLRTVVILNWFISL